MLKTLQHLPSLPIAIRGICIICITYRADNSDLRPPLEITILLPTVHSPASLSPSFTNTKVQKLESKGQIQLTGHFCKALLEHNIQTIIYKIVCCDFLSGYHCRLEWPGCSRNNVIHKAKIFMI